MREPECTGFDWTETFVPSSLSAERLVGSCSWLSQEGEYNRVEYYINPDGTARTVRRAGEETEEEIHELGSWRCDRFTTWPRGFGARSGTQVVPVPH